MGRVMNRPDASGVLAGIHRYWLQERVIYGNAAEEAVVDEAKALGAGRVFIMTNHSLSGKTGLAAVVAKRLGGLHAGTFSGITAHSPRECVIAGTIEARAAGADSLVAIGGGSVVDATKVMLLCLWEGILSAEELDRYRSAPTSVDPSRRPRGMEHAIRMIAVPTTYSAAEFTFFAGVTDSKSRAKEMYSHPLFTPVAVILDPAATLATPLELLLSTGMKAVDHAVEHLCAIGTNPYSNATSGEALRLLGRALPAIKTHPADVGPRLSGQLGAWLSITAAMSGVGVGASHAIGHTLGGFYGVPHGITSCVTLPAVLRWNAKMNEAQQKKISILFGKPDVAAAALVTALITNLGLPGHLRDVGIKREDFRAIAEHTMHDDAIATNPRPVQSPEDLLEILELAW